MPDDRKKCSILIPLEILSKLEKRGYTSQTEAVLAGLECLLRDDHEKIKEDYERMKEDARERKKIIGR